MNGPPGNGINGLYPALLSYGLSACAGALGLLNWVMLRELQLALVKNSPISPWSWQAIDHFSFLLFGMMWLSFVLFIQHYFAKGAGCGRLWSRATATIGIQLLLLFACQAMPLLLGIVRFGAAGAAMLVAEAAAGAGLAALGRYLAVKANYRTKGRNVS